ncbi:MAG: hypothetical protein PVSMB1_07140 [Gemmatimonadaceae bacterium]
MGTVHQVQQGEYLALIARKYGFHDWRTIYDSPDNADLRKRRPNPNVLYPGDKVHIPDKRPKHVPAATGRAHRFKVKGPGRTMLRVVLKDEKGQVLGNVPCTLEVGGRKDKIKSTAQGVIEKKIPLGTKTAKLTLDRWAITWDLEVGELDPVEDPVGKAAVISGVQARLNNLVFHCGAVDGVLVPETTAALGVFQRLVLKRDQPSGDPDDDTRAALLQHHVS